MAIVLAIDAMGGDHGVNITVPACLRFLSETTDVNLVLLNVLGKEQMIQNSSTPSQTHEGTLDLSKFNTGAYILKFKVGEKIITKKIIKN